MIGNRRMIWRVSMWTPQYGYIYVCHTSSRSSSCTRLFGKPTIYQESTFEVCETIISEKLKGWSKIKWRSQVCPPLNRTSQCGEKHLYCVMELFISWNPKPTSLPTQCCVWEVSVLNQSKLGKTKVNGIWRHAISNIWIESMGSRWNSSGKFPRVHCIDNSRWDSEDDGGIEVWTRAISRKDHLHVNVQWHYLERTRE